MNEAPISHLHDNIQNIVYGRKVIKDTSILVSEAELLIGNIITSSSFHRYQRYKTEGELDQKPVISVVIEEAPRILSKETIAKNGDNITAQLLEKVGSLE